MKTPFIRVKIVSLIVYELNFIVLLKPDNTDLVLPIYIGPAEAHSIAAILFNRPFKRPLCHDLMKNALEELKCKVLRVIIVDLVDGTFYARVFVRQADGKQIELDSRPSDALALGVRFNAEMYVRKDVFEDNAIRSEESREGASTNIAQKGMYSVSRLQEQLDEAVREERYEDAVKIRDRMKELKDD